MRIVFSCEHCGRELNVGERLAGRRVRCPDCAALLVIPEPQAESPEPEESSAQGVEESFVEMEAVEEAEPEQQPLAEPPRLIPPPPPKQATAASAPSPPPRAISQPARSDKPPIVLPNRKHPEDLIDMTAMVDIVFFLLIFFLSSSCSSSSIVFFISSSSSSKTSADNVSSNSFGSYLFSKME